jgi:hypothetical protein
MFGFSQSTAGASKRSRTRPAIEALESRVAAAAVQPTVVEQLLLERLNDLRANPASYGLNARTMPPMALEPRIRPAVELVLRHRGVGVDTVKSTMTRSGVSWNSRFSFEADLGASDGPVAGTPAEVSRTVEDFWRFYVAFGARSNLIGRPWHPNYRTHRLVGLVFQQGPDPNVPVEFGKITVAPRQDRPILTGTVFRDLNQNGKYDIGEGLTGVKVQVSGNLGATSVWDTGGYTLPVSVRRAMALTVTASGGTLNEPLTQTVLVRPGVNTRVSFIVT